MTDGKISDEEFARAASMLPTAGAVSATRQDDPVEVEASLVSAQRSNAARMLQHGQHWRAPLAPGVARWVGIAAACAFVGTLLPLSALRAAGGVFLLWRFSAMFVTIGLLLGVPYAFAKLFHACARNMRIGRHVSEPVSLHFFDAAPLGAYVFLATLPLVYSFTEHLHLPVKIAGAVWFALGVWLWPAALTQIARSDRFEAVLELPSIVSAARSAGPRYRRALGIGLVVVFGSLLGWVFLIGPLIARWPIAVVLVYTAFVATLAYANGVIGAYLADFVAGDRADESVVGRSFD